MYHQQVHITKKAIRMKTSFTNSFLTSPREADQREGITTPHSSPYLRGGWVGLKRGKGRFFNNDALLKYSLVTLVILVSFILPAASNASILLDRVVAVVNKEVITWSDLYKAMEFEATTQTKNLSKEEQKKLFKENEASFLETLIDMNLQ